MGRRTKARNVKKHRVTDLTISSVDAGDRGAGDGCRVMLIKRDPVLVAIDAAFADHRLGVDNAFTESIIDGTGGAGFDRRAARLRKKLDRKLRAVRQTAEVRPPDQTDDRQSLSAGADPSDVESGGAFVGDVVGTKEMLALCVGGPRSARRPSAPRADRPASRPVR